MGAEWLMQKGRAASSVPTPLMGHLLVQGPVDPSQGLGLGAFPGNKKQEVSSKWEGEAVLCPCTNLENAFVTKKLQLDCFYGTKPKTSSRNRKQILPTT